MRINKQVVILVAGALVVIWLIFRLVSAIGFNMASTTPNTNSIGTSTSFLQVNFNHKLSPNSVQLSSSPFVIDSYKVDGSHLIIYLSTPMTLGQKYTIVINSIHDTGSGHLTNKTITFTTKDLSSQQIIKSQGGVGKPKPQPYGPNSVTIAGNGQLLDAGMTTDNMSMLKYDVFLYATTTKQQITSFDVVDPTNIVHKAPSMNPDGSSSWEFAAKINNKDVLTAKVSTLSTDDARLYLYNGSTLVFDSNGAGQQQ